MGVAGPDGAGGVDAGPEEPARAEPESGDVGTAAPGPTRPSSVDAFDAFDRSTPGTVADDGAEVLAGISTSLVSGGVAGPVVGRERNTVRSASSARTMRSRYSASNRVSASTSASSVSRRPARSTISSSRRRRSASPRRRASASDVGDEPARRDLGLVEHLARLGGRFRDCFVGRPLREQQRAVQDVLGLAVADRLGLRRRQPLLQLRHPLVRGLDRHGRPLEEVVDLVAAVPADL